MIWGFLFLFLFDLRESEGKERKEQADMERSTQLYSVYADVMDNPLIKMFPSDLIELTSLLYESKSTTTG